MTEVRPCRHGQGVFAVRDFERGEVVLEEKRPLLVVRPGDEDVRSQLSRAGHAAWRRGEVDSGGGGGGGGERTKDDVARWRAAVRAACSYAVAFHGDDDDDDKKEERRAALLSLHRPDDERLIDVVHRAVDHCARHCRRRCSDDDDDDVAVPLAACLELSREDVIKAALAHAGNAFEGGRLYETACRVNHACGVHNCVVDEDEDEDDALRLRALVDVDAGTELAVCYLSPPETSWADRRTRRSLLRRAKYFDCGCARCASSGRDVAASVPCPVCHPRVRGRWLEEDAQWDDDEDRYTVRYAAPTRDDRPRVLRCTTCDADHDLSAIKAGDSTLAEVCASVVDKVTARLTSLDDDDDDDENADARRRGLEERLHRLSSSVLGARHWTTHLLSLAALDRTLGDVHAAVLTGRRGRDDLERLAGAVHDLSRAWEFDAGVRPEWTAALLFRPTLGVARALIALGDDKSRNHGRTWLTKVADHAERVLPDTDADVRTVVRALLTGADDEHAVSTTTMPTHEEDDADEGGNRRSKKVRAA